jgi:hypothetical protein
LANNGQYGLWASGDFTVTANQITTHGNGIVGVRAENFAFVLVGRSTLDGWSVDGKGCVASYGDNYVGGQTQPCLANTLNVKT